MALFNWLEKGVKRMHWYDVAMVKWSVLFFTLFLITAWPWFRALVFSIPWYWHLALGIAAAARPAYRLFR